MSYLNCASVLCAVAVVHCIVLVIWRVSDISIVIQGGLAVRQCFSEEEKEDGDGEEGE